MMRRGVAQQHGSAGVQTLSHGQRRLAGRHVNWRLDPMRLGHGCGHLGHGLHPMRRLKQQGLPHRHGPIFATTPLARRAQHVQRAATAYRLAQALCKQRMVFAQATAHHQGVLELAKFGHLHAQPADPTGTAMLGMA